MPETQSMKLSQISKALKSKENMTKYIKDNFKDVVFAFMQMGFAGVLLIVLWGVWEDRKIEHASAKEETAAKIELAKSLQKLSDSVESLEDKID